MRRDERTQAIADKAARNSFIPAAGDHGLWPWRNTPSCGRPVPTLDGGCRPTWALDKGPRALPVGFHRPDAGCRVDRRLLRIDRENRRPNCSCVSSRASWHDHALRRRHLAPSDVAAQRRTVGGSERYCRVGLRPPNGRAKLQANS